MRQDELNPHGRLVFAPKLRNTRRGFGGGSGIPRRIRLPMSTTTHPLDGCWAKIERAKEQVGHLEGEITTLLNSGAYTIVGDNQFDRQSYAFKLLGPPVPLRIAVITGEIIHHLASCFDHIVWALAKKNGLADIKRSNFPVCQTPVKFKEAVRKGALKGISASEHPLIEALQPYRSSDPSNSILQIVHDLDITDKHKLLVVVTHTLVMGNMLVITKNDNSDPAFGIELPPAMGQYPWAIEEGIEVHWIPLRGLPNPEFEMTVNSHIQIAFEEIGAVNR
jgi:hypothetical protein